MFNEFTSWRCQNIYLHPGNENYIAELVHITPRTMTDLPRWRKKIIGREICQEEEPTQTLLTDADAVEVEMVLFAVAFYTVM